MTRQAYAEARRQLERLARWEAQLTDEQRWEIESGRPMTGRFAMPADFEINESEEG